MTERERSKEFTVRALRMFLDAKGIPEEGPLTPDQENILRAMVATPEHGKQVGISMGVGEETAREVVEDTIEFLQARLAKAKETIH